MHRNHTLLDTAIEGYAIEDFVYSYYHLDASMPGFFQDVVLLVAKLKSKYEQQEISLNEAVRQIRWAWGQILGYIFTTDICPGERALVKDMFSYVPETLAPKP